LSFSAKASRIQNPLAGISTTLLLQDVEDFANKHGLNDALPLLRKGALVARDPTNYEEITGAEKLNDSEIDALRDEVLHKWKQPLALYLTIVSVRSKPLSCAAQHLLDLQQINIRGYSTSHSAVKLLLTSHSSAQSVLLFKDGIKQVNLLSLPCLNIDQVSSSEALGFIRACLLTLHRFQWRKFILPTILPS
jgi:hypothetical protein